MLSLPALVLAQTGSPPNAVAPGGFEVSVTGYVDSRTTGAWTQFDGAPGLTELAEANAQLKIKPHDKLTLYTDSSLFWQGAWFIEGGDRDLANYRPTVVVSEAYVDWSAQEHFRLLAGKKRIVWGAGLAFNPTDVLNPPKDPTDPTSQRAGAWLAEAEWSFERIALSLVGAGKVTRQFAGLPTGLVLYPEFADGRDDEPHYAFAARLYLLIADIDINLIYAFTNLYNDAFQNKSKVGLSLSRVFGQLEAHVEAMAYSGTSRVHVNSACVEQPAFCVFRGVPIILRPDLEKTWLNAQALVGVRWQFDNGGMLGAEYYFNGEGQDRSGYRKLATLVLQNPAIAQAQLTGTTDPGTPQKFQLSALRQHYLVIQGSRPQLFDDWTLGGTVILGLEDLSMQLVPQVSWQPLEWLQLTAAAYIPIAGLDSEAIEVEGVKYGQFTLSPFQTRVLFSARAFF
ncbi:MAG: hypothetical protein JNM17_08720 [Archangium sp.]|nr:hypothetical protein [Archangium sp.]